MTNTVSSFNFMQIIKRQKREKTLRADKLWEENEYFNNA